MGNDPGWIVGDNRDACAYTCEAYVTRDAVSVAARQEAVTTENMAAIVAAAKGHGAPHRCASTSSSAELYAPYVSGSTCYVATAATNAHENTLDGTGRLCCCVDYVADPAADPNVVCPSSPPACAKAGRTPAGCAAAAAKDDLECVFMSAWKTVRNAQIRKLQLRKKRSSNRRRKKALGRRIGAIARRYAACKGGCMALHGACANQCRAVCDEHPGCEWRVGGRGCGPMATKSPTVFIP